nr:NAD(P)-binding domain-containing protein [Gemmatimonadaceae bacterium]
MTRAAVVGGGAWGTALADLLARNGHQVALWAHEPDVVQSIRERGENSHFFGGHPLAPSLAATTDLRDAVAGAELICFATPSQHLRAVVRRANAAISAGAVLAVASKGIEVGTLALMTDVVAAEAPSRPVIALSGPSFADEVARRQPTAIVAASELPWAASAIQD